MKKYSMIDILKFIFAICVVGIHTGIMQDQNSTLQWVIFHSFFRLAVPFFFICSGFFLGLKLYKTDDINTGISEIKNYIKRLLIPFAFWLIFGLPAQIYQLRKESILICFLKLIRSVLFYPWGALWYVLAVIVAIIIIIPFYKKNKIEYAVILGMFLYLFALICNNYYFVIENTAFHKIVDTYLHIFISARNGLFMGLFFVSAGIYIGKLMLNNKNFNIKTHSILFILSFIILIIEILFIKDFSHKDDHSLFIAFILLIPELLIVSTKINLKIDSKKLRNYSTGIYFTHRPIINTIKIIEHIFKFNTQNYILFSCTTGISLLILTILYKIDNKYLNKVIK